MTEKALSRSYFEWLCGFVYDDKVSNYISYRRLLTKLHNTEFTYLIGLDGNRAKDGIDLRYRFGYENDIPNPEIATVLDCKPCSILEMMLALAIRCEEHIVFDDDIGNRTGQWFWNMIVSLGLSGMTDTRFDDDYANEIIDRFLNREYERDGKGGLFTLSECTRDLRNVEIWYQAMWYFRENGG